METKASQGEAAGPLSPLPWKSGLPGTCPFPSFRCNLGDTLNVSGQSRVGTDKTAPRLEVFRGLER